MTFPILLAFMQSLQLSHSDIQVGFLACNPRLHGRQEEFLQGMGQSLKLSVRGFESANKAANSFNIFMYFYNLQDYLDKFG